MRFGPAVEQQAMLRANGWLEAETSGQGLQFTEAARRVLEAEIHMLNSLEHVQPGDETKSLRIHAEYRSRDRRYEACAPRRQAGVILLDMFRQFNIGAIE
jgi:hypothetical protein